MSQIFKSIAQRGIFLNHLVGRQGSVLSVSTSARRLLSDEKSNEISEEVKTGGFAKAFEKYTSPQTEKIVEDNQTFASLLRNSKMIDVSIL